MDKIIDIIILVLATYGLSSLLVDYAGPFELLDRLRKKFTNSPLHCIVCTALWVAICLFILAFLPGFTNYLIPMAIVGTIIILEKLW